MVVREEKCPQPTDGRLRIHPLLTPHKAIVPSGLSALPIPGEFVVDWWFVLAAESGRVGSFFVSVPSFASAAVSVAWWANQEQGTGSRKRPSSIRNDPNFPARTCTKRVQECKATLSLSTPRRCLGFHQSDGGKVRGRLAED